jgi:hypothetical protein
VGKAQVGGSERDLVHDPPVGSARESAQFPTGVNDVGSSSLLVIQVHGSKIATSEERVANWKILVNQWRNEHSCRDELSHHLVFTKNDEEP